MRPDDDPERCPLCHERCAFQVRSQGWVRFFCPPCEFSWTDRLDIPNRDALYGRIRSHGKLRPRR